MHKNIDSDRVQEIYLTSPKRAGSVRAMEPTFEQRLKNMMDKEAAKEVRRQEVLALRLEGKTLQEIGTIYGKTREWARQMLGGGK